MSTALAITAGNYPRFIPRNKNSICGTNEKQGISKC